MGELTHFNKQGRARMVDVTEKAVTHRRCSRSGCGRRRYRPCGGLRVLRGDAPAAFEQPALRKIRTPAPEGRGLFLPEELWGRGR